jgi:predicted amidohydrolase
MPLQVKVIRRESSLSLNNMGCIDLRLIQNLSKRVRIGDRTGLERSLEAADEDEVHALKEQLRACRKQTLTVLAFHPAVQKCRKKIEKFSKNKTIVALANIERGRNVSYIAADGKLLQQDKISLASEDRKAGISSGDKLYVFTPDSNASVRWAVLNCHDYSHVNLLQKLQDEEIELLVVITHNAAQKLYWEYARADVHRLFCFVVIANAGELGGSAVFAPFRRTGKEKNAALNLASQIFGATGQTEIDVNLSLDIGYLRSLRQTYAENGYASEVDGADISPISPPQRFLKTDDGCEAGPIASIDVKTVFLAWNSVNPRVAFCQLASLPLKVYTDNAYRLDRDTPSALRLRGGLDAKLRELELRCVQEDKNEAWELAEQEEKIKGKAGIRKKQEKIPKKGVGTLDFLVFPEVFIPRSYIPKLQAFSNKNNTIIVAGVDYPASENANECLIIAPHVEPTAYRKITRSQYDACGIDKKSPRLMLKRGNKLLRFENGQGATFGVLICYDFSHLELMAAINLDNGKTKPLDFLMVVSHNPSGDLYRYCCISDAHRFYQHTLMCNVAEYGGSGIFAPTREAGTRRVLCEVGKGIEAIGMRRLDLAGQRAARTVSDEYLHKGLYMRKPGLYQHTLVFSEEENRAWRTPPRHPPGTTNLQIECGASP